ncbi:TonB-dependent receptor [Sphingomonas sp. NIBR02145]|uniref:TonB-dependent receptor n=1 Tax=Sphingomonas sp. NIBR02145 TaxID=3014784 RepID=UPI0022B45C3E|nr:TonB-dependent receptor [Sphingomonas sp. NIBR02145]WHU04894.1 TonB-dependent receptor [Sphingomonas sp. NIBR02145]
MALSNHAAILRTLSLSASTRTLGAALLLLGATPAFAQDTNPAPAPADQSTGDEAALVVTGIRASLTSSANIKRNNVTIVDSVSSEDIGKLPDVSIADSLARIPGVTAQRLEGRDQRLSIRGLGPDFSTTLLNGREQVTVGDNRGVEYDQYPSEFFKNVNVYKSADASLIAAGIAGTVDLRMLRPLDQKKDTFVVSARGQMNEKDKLNPDGTRYGYKASATYVGKFANDTLGIALGVSAQSTPTQIERYAAWGFPSEPAAGGNLFLGGAKPYVQSNLLKRYGGVATVEWAPSDNFHSTLDVLYSNFKETQHLRGIEFGTAPTWGSNGVIAPGYKVENGLVTDATISNLVNVQRNDLNERKAENISIGWNNDFKLSDTIHFNVDASWSRATRTDFLLETYSGTGYNSTGAKDTVHITQNSDGTYDIVPTLDYSNTSVIRLTDPRGWGYNGTTAVVQAGFLNRPDFTDDLKSLRASFKGEIAGSVLSGWEVGGNYSRREKQSKYTSYFLCPKGGGTNCTVASGTPTSVAVPADAVLSESVSLDYLGVPKMLTVDPMKIYGLLNSVFDNRPDSLVRDNTVTEDVITGYAKLTVDGEVGGKALKGSLGLQVVHTKQGGDGQIASLLNGVVTISPVSASTSYTNFLPSASFSLELEPNFYIKLGAAQTMVRPRLDQERVTQAVSIDISKIGMGSLPQNSPFSSNGGNANLRPYQSTNIDISFEKYLGNSGGYLALTGFFKHLTDFVDPNNSVLYDFTPLLAALTPAQQAIVRGQNAQFGLVSSPANTGNGDILGLEATASLPFTVFSSALDGFGVFASGTYVDSKIRYGNSATPITLPGQSKWVATATAYYEKGGFQARATYRWRDSFLAELAGLSANPEYRLGRAEGVLDAQIGYEFKSGPLAGLSILAQAKNITDQPFVTTEATDKRLVREYQRYGRDYYLGLTYKF